MNKWLNSAVKSYTDKFGLTGDPVVYEVGSRDGKDGEELARRIYGTDDKPHDINTHPFWKDATVVLFECNPPQIEAIKHTYPEAILVTDAISDKEGTAEFLQIHGDKNQIGSSSMNLNRAKEPWARDNSTITVRTRRLDDVIEDLSHQNTVIDIMKIDIEHYTYEALVGLGDFIRNVRVFHLETEIEGVARDKTNLDIALFMQERGYLCTALENEWGETIQDQVWVRQ